jgi:cell pole-organizing protein PopZ
MQQPEPEAEPEPLELTPAQMVVEEQKVDKAAGLSFEAMLGRHAREPAAPADAPQLVDPEDVTFEPDELEPTSTAFAPSPVRAPIVPPPRPAAAQPQPAPRPAPSVAQAAPMPDPTLSRDMAEQLLEPTTGVAVKHTLARLQGVSMAGSGVTLDGLMREMLRPMLKEWLDEHLPAVVERMVEKEIARISRGGE